MWAPRYWASRYWAPRYWPPGAEVAVAEVKAGRHKRYVLPDGQIFTDELEALAEFDRQLRVRAAELDALRAVPQSLPSRQKRKRSRSIHPRKGPVQLTGLPLPEIIKRLPEAERAQIDLELVELAERFARQRADEEALLLLIT